MTSAERIQVEVLDKSMWTLGGVAVRAVVSQSIFMSNLAKGSDQGCLATCCCRLQAVECASQGTTLLFAGAHPQQALLKLSG
jgi:hypothetical protein